LETHVTTDHDHPNAPQTTDSYSVQVSHDGRAVASADVVASTEPHGTATVTFHSASADSGPGPHGELPSDARRELVDTVMAQPGVRSSDHLHAVVPLGDSPTVTRLQQRTDNFTARAAGVSAIIDADVSPAGDHGRE
jgi:hypothetical protein